MAMTSEAPQDSIPTAPAELPQGPSQRGRLGGLGVVWLVMALILLGTSGLIRVWQDQRLEAAAEVAETAPFAMADLPRDLGRWKALGPDETLPPETLAIAGASDYVARSYTDEQTGVSLSLLVVYGPAERVVGHIPEVCYPATGYKPAGAASSRELQLDSRTIPFRSLTYVKDDDSVIDLQEVYYSFRHAGRWAPVTDETRKLHRIRPATFKVQVQRSISQTEKRDLNNPIESLLSELLPVLEQRITASGADQRQG